MIKINAYHRRMAQSTLEYAMVVACLAGAIWAMQIYVKRSVQGRIRDAAEEIGEQYSPKTTKSSLIQTIVTPKDKSGKEQYVTTKGQSKFIDVTDAKTGLTEKREIMEITRTEPVSISMDPGSYEQTGTIAEEGGLFDDPKKP